MAYSVNVPQSTAQQHTLHLPGQEGVVLFDGVHLVGGGIAPLAGQRFLGVVGGGGARAGDVDVAAAEVAAGLQAGGRQALPAGHHEARRQQVLVLLQNHEGEPGSLAGQLHHGLQVNTRENDGGLPAGR